MDVVSLPVQGAIEPNEEARQPRMDEAGCPSVRFVETNSSVTQNTNEYHSNLSQPPKDICHKQKLQWLQQRRTAGLWAQCDDCDRWRYLPQVLDSHELPTKWYCWMNPDTSSATCLAPEAPICLHDEDDLIHAEYAAGSLVLARMPGFPWWPAMVCDCPDTEQYYWLNGFSDIPTHYNVVFFDAFDISRAWIAPNQLMPYKNNSKLLKNSMKTKKFKNRLEVAITQANNAETLPLSARLSKYSFIERFRGQILTPKKLKKREASKYRNMLKRKFNVDFAESLSPENQFEEDNIKKVKIVMEIKKTVAVNNTKEQKDTIDNVVLLEATPENVNNTIDLNSLAAQIDSASGLNKAIVSEDTNNKEPETNSTCNSFAQRSYKSLESQDVTGIEPCIEADSENSDNFDF